MLLFEEDGELEMGIKGGGGRGVEEEVKYLPGGTEGRRN